jgi:surface polysaccharide O-acyltransferase-like enzyme
MRTKSVISTIAVLATACARAVKSRMAAASPLSPQEAFATSARIVPLDRARTFITLLVVLYHSVINYTYFGIGGDRMRWLGFDLVVLFNDSFFMACMFFISGLFVRDSLARRGWTNFLANRAWRLGIPYLISIFAVMPMAYFRYQLPGGPDFSFFHFWWHMLTTGPWPTGSAWFLWVLLTLDAIVSLLWALAPRGIEGLGHRFYALRDRPIIAFAAFLVFSIIIYLPLRLRFGDASWFTPDHYPFPIQTSRILLYAGYFFAGVGVGAAGLSVGPLTENGAVATRWIVWLAFALTFYGAILLLVYAHHNWVADFRSPSLWWHTAYGLAFAMFSAAMTFTVLAVFLCFNRSSFWLLDAMQPSAYGIYLLHFIPLIWLQYLVYDPAFPAFVKFATVFTGTLSISWVLTVLLRKIPVAARMI